MSVIVFNKNTGKYLKKHSGSFNKLKNSILYRNAAYIKEVIDTLGEDCLNNWREKKQHENEIAKIRDKYLYNASTEEARVYHSGSSVLSSVGEGIWDKDKQVFKYTLPDYLEIHEIKTSYVCIMRPDGSSNCDEKK